MGKFIARVLRKDSDSAADHNHKMPKGKRAEEFTGPMLMKPNGHHSHLYTIEGGDQRETSVADTGVAHEHETAFGDTGPAVVISPKEMEDDKEYKAGDQDGIVGGVNKNERGARIDAEQEKSVSYKGKNYVVKISPDIAARGGANGKGTTTHVWTDNGMKGYQGPYSEAKVLDLIKKNVGTSDGEEMKDAENYNGWKIDIIPTKSEAGFVNGYTWKASKGSKVLNGQNIGQGKFEYSKEALQVAKHWIDKQGSQDAEEMKDVGIEPTMKEFAKGKLKSSSGEKVTDPKQAAAIGYSEERGDSLTRRWGSRIHTK